MNQKKAKLLRRLAKQEGIYKLEPDYRVKETKKMVYGLGADGKRMAQQVTRHTTINANRIMYRRLKQSYKNGEITVS